MKEKNAISPVGQLASDKELSSLLKLRRMLDIKETFPIGAPLIEDRLNNGWQVDVEFKTKIRLSRDKPYDIEFEDKVWCLFAMLGFVHMNRDRYFQMPIDKNDPSIVEQFEVFAKDDETVIFAKCYSERSNKIRNFAQEIETLKGKAEHFRPMLSKLFPGKKPKIALLLATRNIGISKDDLDRLTAIRAIHFPEETVNYYQELYKEIGFAAKYQLLGGLFAGQEIPDLEIDIPAIKGKMGGHTYFSFSIEPEKLLKIGYVLHRNKAHADMMPAYQRLIKRKRLQEIHRFIDEEKGYFPNSIIINIDIDEKKKTIFEPSGNQVENSISKIGILHLPKKYRSAFIIDGQHRLFGYSNSQYKSTNTIPVVALVNLGRSEQVKIFMQINENQKSVGKDLQNTLNAEILWSSDKLQERLIALKSKIAINLGENRLSPFFDKISIGEDKKLISTDAIIRGLKRTDFFGKVKKNVLELKGTFFFGDLDRAYQEISDYLFSAFGLLKERLETTWNDKDNLVVSNRGFLGIILAMNDIVNYLLELKQISSNSTPKIIFEKSRPYLETLASFFLNTEEAELTSLRKAYGYGADPKFHGTLQLALRKGHPDMTLVGLDEFLLKEENRNKEQAFTLVSEIEEIHLKKYIRTKLEAEFGNSWLKKGLPAKIYSEIHQLATEKNRLVENEEDEVDPYDQLHMINYREIVKQNWNIFESSFKMPADKKIQGKDNCTKWMERLNSIRNDISHTRFIDNEALNFLITLRKWLSERPD